MPDAVGVRGQHQVQLAEIAVVDERPVVLAAADHAHQAVGGVLEHVADDAARAAVDDAGAHDDRAQVRRRRRRARAVSCGARHAESSIGLTGARLVHRRRARAEHPDAGGVDEEPAGGAARTGASSVSSASASSACPRGESSTRCESTPSAAAADCRRSVAGCARSPSTGCAPRAWTAPPSRCCAPARRHGARARTSASSTAEPM